MMNRTSFAAALALAGLAAASPALAQMGPPDPWGEGTVSRAEAPALAGKRFDTLDTNHDGVLSTEEMAAARPQGMGGRMGEGRRGTGMRMMSRMADGNHDGKITRDEFIAAQLRRFDKSDTNHDGQLTKAERVAAFQAMRERMMERMGGMSGMGGNMPSDGN